MPRLVSIAGEQHLSRPLLLEVSPFFSRDRSFESAHGALVTSRASRERIKYLPRPDAGGRAMPPRLITNAPVNQSGSDSSRSNAIRFFAVSNNDRELIKRNKPTESKKTSAGKNPNDAPPSPLRPRPPTPRARFFLAFLFYLPPSPILGSSSPPREIQSRERLAGTTVPTTSFVQSGRRTVEKEKRDLGRCATETGNERERERGGGIEGEGGRQLGPRTKTKTSLTAS